VYVPPQKDDNHDDDNEHTEYNCNCRASDNADRTVWQMMCYKQIKQRMQNNSNYSEYLVRRALSRFINGQMNMWVHFERKRCTNIEVDELEGNLSVKYDTIVLKRCKKCWSVLRGSIVLEQKDEKNQGSKRAQSRKWPLKWYAFLLCLLSSQSATFCTITMFIY